MTGAGLPWLRLWCDFPDDFRVCTVPEAMQARLVKLWCLHRRGHLVGAPVEQIAFELRLPVADVEETLRVLTDAGLLNADRTPHGWDSRQRPSDDAAPRMREIRAARREAKADPSPDPSPRIEQNRLDNALSEQVPNTFGTRSEHGSPGAGSPGGVLVPLKDGTSFTPTPAQLAAWRAAFPGVDVERELRHAAAWCQESPERRKTSRGVGRFVVGWLGRTKPTAQAVGAVLPSLDDRRRREVGHV
jgi:DNA-binding transcriptional ArsR family regulator